MPNLSKTKFQSETSLCRPRLCKYCTGMGIDIGFGGDPISPRAITMDLPTPYCIVGNHPQNLCGDARSLYWFQNEVLDYVFSSHLIEDFQTEEIQQIITEWLRVLKPGGYLVLYSPNQRLYVAHCLKTKTTPNQAHKKTDFALTYLLKFIEARFKDQYTIIEANEPVDTYSFDLVLQKKGLKTVPQDAPQSHYAP